MKGKVKLLTGILFVLLLVTAFPIFAEAKEYVFDYYDFLDDAEEKMLNAELSEIYNTYGFEAILLISEDVYADEQRYAADFMQDNHIGYGSEMDGMCIFHQPDSRSIAIVFRGQYQDDFSAKIRDIMLDDCTIELKADNVVDAYLSLIADLDNGLERAVSGKVIRPLDVDDEGIVNYAVKWLLLSFAIMAVPVLLLVLVQTMRMKTRMPQKNADFYAMDESFKLGMCRDIYLRTDVKKVRIEKDNHGPGRNGSFSSKGESFSGSSRKY